MNRQCPIDNCTNNRPSVGRRANGEQKFRPYCNKHRKEKRATTWYAKPMPEKKKETITVTMTQMQFNFFFIFCMWGLLNLFFWGICVIEFFIK